MPSLKTTSRLSSRQHRTSNNSTAAESRPLFRRTVEEVVYNQRTKAGNQPRRSVMLEKPPPPVAAARQSMDWTTNRSRPAVGFAHVKIVLDLIPDSDSRQQSVPLEIIQKSFVERELEEQLDAIESRANDQLRYFRRRLKHRNKAHNGLYRLVPMSTASVVTDDVMPTADDPPTSAVCEASRPEATSLTQTQNAGAQKSAIIYGDCDNDKNNGDDENDIHSKLKSFRLWFDVSDFERKSVKVTYNVVLKTVEVSAVLLEGSQAHIHRRCVPVSGNYEVANQSLRAIRSADGQLLVKGLTSCTERATPKTESMGNYMGDWEEEATLIDASDDDETGTDESATKTSTADKKQLREKIGVATFVKDEDGVRRMKLIIDMGKEFHSSDVVIQFINACKIQVSAKNQSKSKETSSKARFKHEYELTEKIECQSLAGHFNQSTGRLIVEALAKRSSGGRQIPELIGKICRACIGWSEAAETNETDGRNLGNENEQCQGVADDSFEVTPKLQ